MDAWIKTKKIEMVKIAIPVASFGVRGLKFIDIKNEPDLKCRILCGGVD